MTEKIQELIDDMYANKTSTVYNEFKKNVPQIQEICNIYLEKNTSEQASTKVHNFIGKLLHYYENMDIVSLADTLQYDLLNDICYSNTVEKCASLSRKDILEKNISALKIRNIDISKLDIKDNNTDIFNGRRFISEMSPEKAARKWKNSIGKIEDYEIIFIYGLSDGSHIREVIKEINDTNHIVVYEPSEIIFINTINRYDISDIIQNVNIELFIENVNDAKFSNSVISSISYNNRNSVKWYVLPNYDVTFQKLMNQFLKKIVTQIRICDFGRNLFLGAESKMLGNMRHNEFDKIKQYNLSQLKIISEINPEKIPAVVVSAGPSLDRNIEQLRNFDKKFFIVVVDSALRTMVNKGIKFHLGITVDPVKPISMFDDEKISNIPMVVEIHSNKDVVKIHKGKRFYYGPDYLSKYIMEKEQKEDVFIREYERVVLETGGSVATDAFSLLVYLGFKTIILIGQDLAFTDNRGHASDVYATEEDNKKHVEESPTICNVKDIYGNDIKTDLQMYSYIDWFESQTKKYKGEIEVIDATEGGAYIEGTKVMTLKEVIEKYCDSGREVDFTQLIENIPPAYNEEEREFLYKSFHIIKKEFEPAEKLINENIKYYTDVLNGKMDIKAILDKININTVKFQMLSLYPLIVRYSQKVEYEINENVFAKDEDSIETIAKKYIRLYEGYMESIKRIVEDWSEYEI